MREHSYNATGKDDAIMAKHSYSKRNRNKVNHREEIAKKDGPPAIVSRKYNVTSMTAYHISKLAAQEGMTEGRVIDKIMRTYLASRGER